MLTAAEKLKEKYAAQKEILLEEIVVEIEEDRNIFLILTDLLNNTNKI